MLYRMLDMRYRSVNIGYCIHRISYRKCAYDMVYDIVCLYYDIVCQPTISYVDIRYPRVPRIQMMAPARTPDPVLLFIALAQLLDFLQVPPSQL